MTCNHTFLIKGVRVPCGKCVACRIMRTQEWATRIVQELSFWESSSFLTLTYDDENLPENGSLVKSDLQKYFKRVRRTLGERKIKYFACGEYGDRFSRPHYHAIVFGINQAEKFIVEQWRKGFVKTGTVTYNSARYVAGYIQKKLNGKMAKEEYGDRQSPFQLQSGGIGKRFVEGNEEYLINNLGFTVDGVKHKLPRYYRKLLGDKITEERLEQRMIEKANDLELQYVKAEYDWRRESEHRRLLPLQREAEIVSKIERWKPREF